MRPGSPSGLGRRVRLDSLLGLDGTPDRVAASLALGVAIGLSPFVGIQSAITLGLAALLRLPFANVLLASYVSNPLTVLPILAAEYGLGRLLMSPAFDRSRPIAWEAIAAGEPRAFFGSFRALDLQALLLGGLVCSVAAGLLSYVLLRRLLGRRATPEALPSPSADRSSRRPEARAASLPTRPGAPESLSAPPPGRR
jgi:uncharacterized protein (DUF2062 family)